MSAELRSLTFQTMLWSTEQPLMKCHGALPDLINAIQKIDDPLFGNYGKDLPVNHIQLAVSKVFKDGGISWPKIVGVFALCAAMVKNFKGKDDVLLKIVGEFTTALHGWTGRWIDAHGGWLTFMNFVKKQEEDKSSLQYAAFTVLATVMVYLIYLNK